MLPGAGPWYLNLRLVSLAITKLPLIFNTSLATMSAFVSNLIPDELLVDIFGKLQVIELVRCRQVSRRCHPS
jgi:hypothetical protein